MYICVFVKMWDTFVTSSTFNVNWQPRMFYLHFQTCEIVDCIRVDEKPVLILDNIMYKKYYLVSFSRWQRGNKESAGHPDPGIQGPFYTSVQSNEEPAVVFLQEMAGLSILINRVLPIPNSYIKKTQIKVIIDNIDDIHVVLCVYLYKS